ncbi:MAG: hypothetical protein JWP97_2940 [Labilithrix sp.]|nr:hypothetical protein [Labilithrix sp.]
MAEPLPEKREIGLKAVHAARAERKRSKFGKIDGRVWLVAGAAVVVTLVLAYLFNDRTLASEREEILTQQRAAVATVGAEWQPLRDRLEKITLGAAAKFDGDKVDFDAAKQDFRASPGLYLRLRVDEAKDLDSLRKHARESTKDAFAGCLLREPNAALARGEIDAGAGGAEQPWNLHRAYKATQVLTPEWASDVKAADDKDKIRVFRQQYDKAKRDEIPVAIDIVKRAQFFLLVLDEDVPEARDLADGGAIDEDAIQQVAHPVRVLIVNLRTGAEIARLRRTAEADVQFAGEHAIRDPETRAAIKRQVNNCALAEQVWAALRPAAPAGSAGK